MGLVSRGFKGRRPSAELPPGQYRRAYPLLLRRDIEVDRRRRLGVWSVSSSLPPGLGLPTSFGRETEPDLTTAGKAGFGADVPLG
jgi:hypothetical protein